MTDNALNYTRSAVFRIALDDLGISHKRNVSRRPQTNGKAERFNRTLLEELAYKISLHLERAATPGPRTLGEVLISDRPHTAIGGLAPLKRLRQQR